MSILQQHFIDLRETLLAMYEDSSAANHTVVTGALREGFIRAAFQGHLPEGLAWSTGQIVGLAPLNDRSGQLDIILHSSNLPQVHIHDGFVRLVPSNAAVCAIEVKSDITTGKIAAGKKVTAVLPAALESMIKAKRVPRSLRRTIPSPIPFHLVAFHSGVSPQKVSSFIQTYLTTKGLPLSDYWPDSVVILKGAKKTAPEGYGLFRNSPLVRLPPAASAVQLNQAPPDLALSQVTGPLALATLVAMLANSATTFVSRRFRLEDYIY